LAKERILPCLTLLYAGIDVIASLETNGKANSEGFKKWVATYLLKDGSFRCSALDLYAARCGVVHTFTAESDLSDSGKARTIAYVLGNADIDRLEPALKLFSGIDEVHINVSHFVTAFKRAIDVYRVEVETEPSRKQSIESLAGLWCTSLAVETLDGFIRLSIPAK
jgi:hypothetical protein